MKKNLILAAILATLSLSVHAADPVPHSSDVTASLFAQAAEARAPLPMPLPGEAGFYFYLDVNKFREACFHLDSVEMTTKFRDGKTIFVACKTPDGGSVGVTTTEKEATVAIHQTAQMSGNAITALDNSVNAVVPLSSFTLTTANKKCAEKVKEAQDSGDSVNYGDVKIEFSATKFEATCEDAPAASANPVSKALQSITSLFKGKQQ